MMAITAKELDLRGSFRFHDEFAVGVDLMRVTPLITQTLHLVLAEDAFRLASDRGRAIKVQISFAEG